MVDLPAAAKFIVALVCCACAEMCELSELSELSPDADCIHGRDGTIFRPTSHVWASVPSVIRRPCHLAWNGLGQAGGVVFPELSKLLNQEDA